MCGPEASGNRFMVQMLCDTGCFGSGTHRQPIDGPAPNYPVVLPQSLPERLAFLRSFPHGGNWPIHCAGLVMRTSSLRAVGGYAGLPFDDDIAMFAALSEATDGWWDERHTWLYRQHPGQTTRDDRWAKWSEACRRIALQRAQAVRHSGMALASVEVNTHDVEVGKASKTGTRPD